MVRQSPFFAAAIVAIAASCGADRQSSAGFRLPPGGDAEAGKAAFLAFGCHSCHTVSGVDLPRPEKASPVPVVLGGMFNYPPGEGQLVTSVIYPSYQLSRYPARDIPAAGESRMPHYADRMTVQQLTNIIAFLQPRYKTRPPDQTAPN